MKRRTKGSTAKAIGPSAANGWQRKADGILDQLGQKVVSGQYGAGRRLPTEAELARRLGVSRPSLREGLKALARKGLVELTAAAWHDGPRQRSLGHFRS